MLLLFLLCSCGPIYLHDPAAQTAATSAQENFMQITTRRSASGFTKSYITQRTVDAEIDLALSTITQQSQISALSSNSWQLIGDSLCRELYATATELGLLATRNAVPNRSSVCEDKRLPDLDKDLSEAASSKFNPPCQASLSATNRKAERDCWQKQMEEALSALPGAQSATKSFMDALNVAADNEARYIATQKLLSAGLLAVVAPSSEAVDQVSTLKTILQEPVSARRFDKNDQGELIEKKTNTTVGKALSINPPNLPASTSGSLSAIDLLHLTNLDGQLSSFQGLLPVSPGIAVTIIGLSYDVARAEELRIRNIISTATRRIKLYDSHIAFLEGQLFRTGEAAGQFGITRQLPEVTSGSTVRDTIQRLRNDFFVQEKEKEKRRDFRGDLAAVYSSLGLWTNAVLSGSVTRQDFPSLISALDAEESLANAEIALREREAVISRGLQGLVAFHEGGIDAQDVNNLLQVAQAIGIFAIAAD
jgi:hypothetical protein